jgi:protein TonB
MIALAHSMEKYFYRALGFAILVHVLGLFFASLDIVPSKIEVPYKTISIRLGKVPNPSGGSKALNQEAPKEIPQPVLKTPYIQPKEPLRAPEPVLKPTVETTPAIQSVAPEKIESEDLSSQKMKESDVPSRLKARAVRTEPEKVPQPPLVQTFNQPKSTVTKYANNPAAASPDVPFVQQVNASSDPKARMELSGSTLGNRTESDRLTILSYEEQLTLWLQRFKVYPMEAQRKGTEGRGIIRIQADRLGNIRFFEMAETTGHEILDAATANMVRRADPLPPMPDDYPSPDFINEFIIPVSFSLEKKPAAIPDFGTSPVDATAAAPSKPTTTTAAPKEPEVIR